MVKETVSNGCDCESRRGVIWEIPRTEKDTPNRNKICGTLILDMDGTLTIPGQDYEIEPEVVGELTSFLEGGGNLVFNTGATTGRIEKTLLSKLYSEIDKKHGSKKANSFFDQVYLNPENGSALLIKKGIQIEENQLSFKWHKIHELHVPNKDKLRDILESEIISKNDDSYILGDWSSEKEGKRDYIVTLKNIEDTLSLKKLIDSDEFKSKYPEVDWKNILVKAARTSIDFIHKDSGKTISTEWLLKELSLIGPVIGFGDLGDEFSKVVPTFNVNLIKPNESRKRGMPAMDVIGGWSPLSEGNYTISDNNIVRDKRDNPINVLLDSQGKIVKSENGDPMEIKPLVVRGDDGKDKVLAGAGKSTAWMIHRLIEIGYFS